MSKVVCNLFVVKQHYQYVCLSSFGAHCICVCQLILIKINRQIDNRATWQLSLFCYCAKWSRRKFWRFAISGINSFLDFSDESINFLTQAKRQPKWQMRKTMIRRGGIPKVNRIQQRRDPGILKSWKNGFRRHTLGKVSQRCFPIIWCQGNPLRIQHLVWRNSNILKLCLIVMLDILKENNCLYFEIRKFFY